ncbi:MAG: MerR family transcriptional regulator [Chitinophagales bacterium]|nr:MerR family transcriptional regulator [Chitinophagales bacterium]
MQLPELTKLYYTIGEVSDLFEVAPSVIRYWESEFPQLRPGKNNKGERKYTAKDIEIIADIYHLVKEKGFKIEGARKELETRKKIQKENNALLQHLKNIRRKAVDLRNTLD